MVPPLVNLDGSSYAALVKGAFEEILSECQDEERGLLKRTLPGLGFRRFPLYVILGLRRFTELIKGLGFGCCLLGVRNLRLRNRALGFRVCPGPVTDKAKKETLNPKHVNPTPF